MAPVTTPWYAVRYTYAIVISLFLVALFFQVYLAGRTVLGADADSGHAGLGWMLAHMVALLPFLLAFFVKGGKKIWVTNIVWAVMIFILPVLAGMVYVEPGSGETASDADRAAAAFHPLMAVLVIMLTTFLSWQSIMLAAEGRIAPATSAAPQARQRGPRA